MPYKAKNSGLAVSRTWRKADMYALAQYAATVITTRVFDKNLTVEGKSLTDHRPYSTDPIYIALNARPAPTGGEPKQASMFFKGGYRQYKLKTHGSEKVTLVGSDDLRMSIRALRTSTTRDEAHIGIADETQIYGLALNEKWPWWGFSDGDRQKIRAEFRSMLAETFKTRRKLPKQGPKR